MTPLLNRHTALQTLTSILRRRKKAMAVAALAVLAAATLLTFAAAKVYRSEAKLLVRLGRENATVDPVTALGKEPVVVLPSTRENEINSIAEILSSRAFVEKVVDALGSDVVLGKAKFEPAAAKSDPGQPPAPAPDPPPASREKAIARLAKNLDVHVVRKSDVIVVNYKSHSPQLAREVVNRLVEFYLDAHRRMNRTAQAQEFLAGQKEQMAGLLRKSEAELQALKDKTGILANEAQRQLLVARMDRLAGALAGKDAELAALTARVARLRELLETQAAVHITASLSGVGNEGTDRMREQYYTLQLQEQAGAAKFTDAHPAMRELRVRTAAAAKTLEFEGKTRTHVTEGPARAHEETQLALVAAEPALRAAEAEARALQAEHAALAEQMKKFNENDVRLVALQRDVELQTAAYRKYAESVEQARIDDAVQEQRISNIRVIGPTLEPRAVRPRVLLSLAAGLALAIAAAVTLAWLLEYLDPTLPPQALAAGGERPLPVGLPHAMAGELAAAGRRT